MNNNQDNFMRVQINCPIYGLMNRALLRPGNEIMAFYVYIKIVGIISKKKKKRVL